MQNSRKNTVVWVVIIILLIVGGYFLFRNKENTESKTDDVVVTPPAESTEDVSTGSVNTATGSTMKYTDAVAKYADKRIQLDALCQAHPNNVTYKTGTTIMIDNRSPQAARVRLGSVFTIKPYGFKIMKLTSSTLPATLLVDCGTSQNVATVLIQK